MSPMSRQDRKAVRAAIKMRKSGASSRQTYNALLNGLGRKKPKKVKQPKQK